MWDSEIKAVAWGWEGGSVELFTHILGGFWRMTNDWLFLPLGEATSFEQVIIYLNLSIALISHTSKVMLKILQARLKQYMNGELPDVQAGFRKGRRIRDQIANIRWIIKKAREF